MKSLPERLRSRALGWRDTETGDLMQEAATELEDRAAESLRLHDTLRRIGTIAGPPGAHPVIAEEMETSQDGYVEEVVYETAHPQPWVVMLHPDGSVWVRRS